MKILIEIEDRVRKDSTCMYFKRAFEQAAETVVAVYPEELEYIRPGKFDLYVRVDYGIDNPWPADLKPSAYYAIDTHIDRDWRLEMARKGDFDYVFCAQPAGAELPWHTDRKYWLPLACEPETHGGRSGGRKTYDVCFIGNTQPSWQGRRVDRLDKLFKAFPNFYYGNVFFRDVTKIYEQSRLVFNSALSDDINMRVFEALASGSCLFTDRQEWKGMFSPGKHFVEYTDEDMADKAKYFLEHAETREHIAREGQAEALGKHTYLHRARKMLEIIKKTGGTNG